MLDQLLTYIEGDNFITTNLSSHAIDQAVASTYEFYQSNKDHDPKIKQARSISMTPENMPKTTQNKEELALQSKHEAAQIISEFFNKTYSTEDITKLELQVNGKTLPVKIIAKDKDEEKKIFVKPFELQRLLGIELYSAITGTNNYTYHFTQDSILEDALPGKHEFEYEKEEFRHIQQTDRYIEQRIQMDLLCKYMGLDDLGKKDNYLITEEGDINIIDFDVLDRIYTTKDITKLRNITKKELHLSHKEYKDIYVFQEFLLKTRLQKKYNQLYNLVALSLELQNEEFSYYLQEKLLKGAR